MPVGLDMAHDAPSSPVQPHEETHFVVSVLKGSYEIGSFLGAGAYGEVFHATKEGASYAIKCLKSSPKASREVEIMQRLQHKNIIKLFETMSHEDYIFMSLEYCNSRNLEEFVQSNRMWTDESTCELIRPLIAAVKHVHDNNIVHRDIKPENILIHKAEDNTLDLKLADFGIAHDSVGSDEHNHTSGTLSFMAPETILGHTYTATSDIYSIGMIMLYVRTGGRLLFDNVSEDNWEENRKHFLRMYSASFHSQISLQKIAEEFKMSAWFSDLLLRLLQYDPNKRMTIEELSALLAVEEQ